MDEFRLTIPYSSYSYHKVIEFHRDNALSDKLSFVMLITHVITLVMEPWHICPIWRAAEHTALLAHCVHVNMNQCTIE